MIIHIDTVRGYLMEVSVQRLPNDSANGTGVFSGPWEESIAAFFNPV